MKQKREDEKKRKETHPNSFQRRPSENKNGFDQVNDLL
jgi:hypothetical protein